MRPTTRFRELLAAPEILVMPGVHDALSARIAEAEGRDGGTAGFQDRMLSFREFTDLIGLPALRESEQRYLDQAAALLAGRGRAAE